MIENSECKGDSIKVNFCPSFEHFRSAADAEGLGRTRIATDEGVHTQVEQHPATRINEVTEGRNGDKRAEP